MAGPSASGKTFCALTLLSARFQVVTESLDSVYRLALERAGLPPGGKSKAAHLGAGGVDRAARQLRTRGAYPKRRVTRFNSEFDSILRERTEMAYALGQSLVLEGSTLGFSDEVSRIASFAADVSEGRCWVVRLNLRPSPKTWQQNRIALAKMRGLGRPRRTTQQYYERKMSPPPKVPGVSDFTVSDPGEVHRIVDQVLSLEKQETTAKRKPGSQAADTTESRFQIQIAERDRLLGQLSAGLAAERGSRRDKLTAAERDLKELRETLRKREIALDATNAELQALTEAVERAARSRSWRLGHGAARLLNRLMRRRTKPEGALEVLLKRLEARQVQGGEVSLAAERTTTRARETMRGRAEMGRGARADRDPGAPEELAWRDFVARYSPALEGADPLPSGLAASAIALPVDRRAVLLAEHDGSTGPGVDVVVCVHNALAQVHECLWSLLAKTDRPFRLILVNDGSDEATSEYLKQFATRNRAVKLVENHRAPHGYTVAANLGLRESGGDYVVLLNSDTIVTFGWLDRIIECGESDDSIGIVGPLSNAASHQSVPELRDEGGWAVNIPPDWLTPDGMAFLTARLSERVRPRFPFINGFCYVVKRSVLDGVGLFDEESFREGYSEENDFSFRAREAGFELAVADDAYVYHAKSRSYGASGRKALAKQHYQRFLQKHGKQRVEALVTELEADQSLAGLRSAIRASTADESAFEEAVRSRLVEPLAVTFVLPGMPWGSSGGVHSIYQEATGMRSLGIPAQIGLEERDWERAEDAYEDAEDVFFAFRDEEDLVRKTAEADVIVSTHFKSVAMVERVLAERQDFLAAYYIQDYEPFFAEPGSENFAEADASYKAIRGQVPFAKTHWLCELVGRLQGLNVAKVEPSIDRTVYHPVEGVRDASGPVAVTAMLRPRTPRRQPLSTLRVLARLKEQLGDRVQVETFGCTREELVRICGSEPGWLSHLGLLKRAEVAELLARSDVFLDGSFYQAFGRTGLEAMACGCTAVMPQLGGANEFVVDGENALLLDTRDEDAVLFALADLVTDRERLGRLQTNAIRTADRYSVLRAALSEYVLFEHEYARRVGRTLRRSSRAARA